MISYIVKENHISSAVMVLLYSEASYTSIIFLKLKVDGGLIFQIEISNSKLVFFFM